MAFSISSTAFSNMKEIPRVYTCDSDDISPPLQWSGVPDNTKSLVLIVDDPDAPDPKAPKMTWVHWVVYNLPPDTNGLSQDASDKTLPAGAMQGVNDWKKTEYGGPCPPIGRHRYFFKLYALDTLLPVMKKASKSDVEQAMKGYIIAQTELVGTYQK